MSLTTDQLRALCIKHAVRPDKNGDIPRNFWNALSELNGMVGGGEPVASAWMHCGVMVNAFPWPPQKGPDAAKWAERGYTALPLYTAPAPTPAPAVEPLSEDESTVVLNALLLARAGYVSEAAMGLPVLDGWRDVTLGSLDKAIATVRKCIGIGAQKGGA